MHSFPEPREQRHHSHLGQPTPPANYCAIPQRLLADLRDTPLAIGLYALVGRLFLVTQVPIALSRADVMRYDPTLKAGAVKRAFDRLVERGWLLAAPQAARAKQRYTPTWGRVKGAALPWRTDAPCLGRPRHIIRLMLDRSLLDVCMGKITPHATRPATITRYITAPVLGLADVGAYALALGEIPHETPNLRRLGLVRAGAAQPLPSVPRLLATISQLQLALDEHAPVDATLTISGTRRLGVQPAPIATDRTQPLFFVPPSLIGPLIGPLIGSMIGSPAENASAPTAAGSGETPVSTPSEGITWESRDLAKAAIPPPTPSAAQSNCGGGAGTEGGQKKQARSGARPIRKRARPAPQVPENPTTQLLRTINVLPEIRIELAGIPVETVQAAIEDGKARPGVRNLAGWVVKLLRTHRDHGWAIAPPTPRADTPEDLRAAFARYAAAQEAERRQGMPEDTPWFEAPTPAPLHAPGALTRLWNEVQAALKAQTPRAEFDAWLRRLSLLGVEGGVATIMAPSALAKAAVEDRYLGMLRELLTTFAGAAVEVRVVLNPSAPAQPSAAPTADAPPAELKTQNSELKTDPPAWIARERWAALPAMLRAALAGSELVDGAVRCRAPHLGRVLEGKYAREVGELITVYALQSELPIAQL